MSPSTVANGSGIGSTTRASVSIDVPTVSLSNTPPDSATGTPTSTELSHRRHARAVILKLPSRTRSIKKRLEDSAAGTVTHGHQWETPMTFLRARWEQVVRLFTSLSMVIISGFRLACSLLSKPQRLLYACSAAVARRFLPSSHSSTSAVSKSSSDSQTSPMAAVHDKRATVWMRILTDVLKLLLVVCVTWMVWKTIELPADCSLLPVLMPPSPCGHSGQGLVDILKEDHGYTAGSPRYYFHGK